MPKRSNEFQKLIFHIHQQLSTNAKVTESKMLREINSEEEREVVIVIESTTGQYNITISIECIGRRRPADVTWVEQMWAKHQKLPTNKLILISKSGFTSQALETSRLYNIDMLSLKEAISSDWKELWSKFITGRFELVDLKYSYKVLFKNVEVETELLQLYPTQLVYFMNGVQASLDALVKSIIYDNRVKDSIFEAMKNNSKQDFTIDFHLPENTYIMTDSKEKQGILILRVLVSATYISTSIDMRPGSIGSTEFAHGQGTTPTSNIVLTFIKREGVSGLQIDGLLADGTGLRKLENIEILMGHNEKN